MNAFLRIAILMFVLCFSCPGDQDYNPDSVGKQRTVPLRLDAKSIPATLDFPERFKNVLNAEIVFVDSKKKVVLIKNGKAAIEKLPDNLRRASFVIIFSDLKIDGFQIDADGKIIFQSFRNEVGFRMRVSAVDFISELLKHYPPN